MDEHLTEILERIHQCLREISATIDEINRNRREIVTSIIYLNSLDYDEDETSDNRTVHSDDTLSLDSDYNDEYNDEHIFMPCICKGCHREVQLDEE